MIAHAGNTRTPDLETVTIPNPYISAKPADGIFNVIVMGDSIAAGLHQGLTQLNKDRNHIATTRMAKVNTGLVRRDRFDWNKAARKIGRDKRHQIVVVVIGPNDLQSIRETGKAHHFQQDGWVTRYRQRLDQLIKDLKSAGKAVYWVGIPITAPDKYSSEYQYLNSFFRQAAMENNIRFVDAWASLANDEGKYDPYWTLENGKKIQIRRRDGIHFTPKGYEVFASLLNEVLLKDIFEARMTNSDFNN